MQILQVINWLLLAAASVLSITLGVVCMLFWIYRAEPIMQASFPELLRQAGLFTGLALIAAAAALSLYRRTKGFWLLQIVLAAAVTFTVNYYIPD